MKALKTVAAVALVLVVGLNLAQAQQYSTAKTRIAVAASGTSNNVAVCTATKYEDVAIHVKTTLAGSGTDNTTISYSKSLDGVTYETTPSVVLTIANTGTTAVNTLTNVTLGAVGYLRLTSIVNGDTGDVLTCTNTFALKPQRFGK
jgi:hypothetical protein